MIPLIRRARNISGDSSIWRDASFLTASCRITGNSIDRAYYAILPSGLNSCRLASPQLIALFGQRPIFRHFRLSSTGGRPARSPAMQRCASSTRHMRRIGSTLLTVPISHAFTLWSCGLQAISMSIPRRTGTALSTQARTCGRNLTNGC